MTNLWLSNSKQFSKSEEDWYEIGIIWKIYMPLAKKLMQEFRSTEKFVEKFRSESRSG